MIKRAGVAALSDIVSGRRKRLTGHVLRLPRERPASVAIDWMPKGGKRKRGRPKKTWRQKAKEELRDRCLLAWSKKGHQTPEQMEGTHRLMFLRNRRN